MQSSPVDWAVLARVDGAWDSDGAFELYQSLFSSAPVAMAVSAPDGRLLEVNSALCELLGYSREELFSDDVIVTHPDDLGANRSLWQSLENYGAPMLSTEKRYVHKSGRTIHGQLKLAPIRDRRGRIVRVVAQVIDLSERRELEARIRELDHTDSTTGLPNRVSVLDHLGNTLGSISRHRNPAFIHVDLNRFKVINATFGQQVGDQLLAKVSARLREVVPPQVFLGRIGGDEFGAVVGDGVGSDIRALAASIRRSMRNPIYINDLELSVDVSIGASVYPKGGLTADELVTNAEIAMYHAKRHHVDFQFYTDSINEYSERLFVQESKLRQAISRKDFYLDFEPAYHVVEMAPGFCEGLLRWRQDGEIVTPNNFVPIAESTGLIRKLDSITLQLAASRETPDASAPITAFNLSRLSLLDGSIVAEIDDLLRVNGTDPANLIVEVTETVAVSDSDQINRTLRSIKALGLRVALDDFGTGFTSFSMVQQLPLDFLKLDKSLIHGIGRRAVDEQIVQATIRIGHELGLASVAEGVETEVQYDWLREQACDFVQGWYMAAQRG